MTHIFGIRHHGPGSARHVKQALETVRPDILLLEGPPEAEAILSWASNKGMEPPVAILAYVPDNPHIALFYPFTFYSPEWQAIQYGLKNNIPIRFIDMPLTHRLAELAEQEQKRKEEEASEKVETKDPDDKKSEDVPETVAIRRNPMSYLAEIAGFDDEEEWWEQYFELSQEDPLLMFETVKNAMKALREALPENNEERDLKREVFMRRNIRQAENEMYENIAVVCGAWHAPALEQKFTQKEENERVKGLPKIKVECTWIPWTNDRLMFATGYGAGIESPGWYEHQWKNPNDDGTIWLTKTAHVFRKQRMDISPAHIIEAVRLAHSLSAIRQLNKAGLNEFTEATQAVMCMGDELPLALLKKELIVGNKLGSIPSDAPQSPLQLDFEKQLKSLRLKVSEGEQILTLDLRKPLDLRKSIFLHRLLILDINWGHKTNVSSKGTFKEQWNLYWKPEMLIELIAKSGLGNSIEQASNTWMKEKIAVENELKQISEWLQLAIPAELTSATESLLDKMDSLAASASDVEALIASMFPLSEILKYGNVRQTDKERVKTIFTTVFYRTIVALPIGCIAINDDMAVELAGQIERLHKVILVLDEADFTKDWFQTVKTICKNDKTVPFVSGSVHKLAYESKIETPQETSDAFSQALSVGTDVADSSRWLEGFLSNAATILLLDEGIWSIVFDWVEALETATFTELLPLLRRTFSEYASPEKNKIALKVKKGKVSAKAENTQESELGMVAEKAIPVAKTIEYLLGLKA